MGIILNKCWDRWYNERVNDTTILIIQTNSHSVGYSN
jgi:hypothetical protein